MAGEQNLAGTLEGASRSSDMHIDGRYEVWLVLDTNTLMQLPEELLAFHAASKDSILPRSGAFRSIDLDIKYYVPQAVIRELDYRKSEGNADDSSGSIAKKARSAARLLDGSELGEITFESSNERSKAEMVFPELMRDAVVSKGDHQILLAAKYMQEVKYKSDSRVRVAMLTDDVNLRSIAAGEGIMALSGPAELPKKRKEFLPKMFPSLPEDSAAARMAASRAKYADNPELEALQRGLSNTSRRKPQLDDYKMPAGPAHWDPAEQTAHLRGLDALPGPLRSGAMSGSLPRSLSRHHSGTPQHQGMQGTGAPGPADLGQRRGSGQAAQGLPSPAQILKILELGVRPCLQIILPHTNPTTWQQDLEKAEGSLQGLLACVVEHRAHLLAVPDDRSCSGAMLKLLQWARNPTIESHQQAQEALTSVSSILNAFKEPNTDGNAKQALLASRTAASHAASHWRERTMQDSPHAPASPQAVLPSLADLSVSEANGGSGGFYMNGHARGLIYPSPFEQYEETSQGRGQVNAQLAGGPPAMQRSASGQGGSQVGSQGHFPGMAGNMQALQMMQAHALQQQQQVSQAQSHGDASAQQQFQAQLLQRHLLMQQQQQQQQQQQHQGPSEPLALQQHEYQQRLQAALQQRQSSLAASQQGVAAPHAALSPEQAQQLQALQQRRSSLSSIGSLQQEPESSHRPMSQQPPPPRILPSQQQPQEQQQQAQPGTQLHSAEYLQQLLQQRQALLEQQHSQQHSLQHGQEHNLQRKQSGQSDAQNMEGDYQDSKSGGPSGQQTPGELQTSMSCESARGRAQGSSPRGLPEGAKTAALMQGMLQEVPKMGTQKQPAARLMLETLLNAVSSIQPRDEESAETQQALEVAVQVLWARLLRVNGVSADDIAKAQPDKQDVCAYLTMNGRAQAKKDAVALLDQLLLE